MGVDGDQADRPLALERTEPLNDGTGLQSEFAVTRNFHGDKIAVHRAAGVGAGNGDLAAKLFLVDRHQPAAAIRQAAKDTEYAVLGPVDEFYDAAGRFFVGLLDAQQRPIADAGNFSGPGAAEDGDVNDRRCAVRLLVPFRRPRQQLTVAVAAGNVGKHHRRQRTGVMQPLTPLLDVSVVGQLAQHFFQRSAVGILGAECTRNLARANLAGMLADES